MLFHGCCSTVLPLFARPFSTLILVHLHRHGYLGLNDAVRCCLCFFIVRANDAFFTTTRFCFRHFQCFCPFLSQGNKGYSDDRVPGLHVLTPLSGVCLGVLHMRSWRKRGRGLALRCQQHALPLENEAAWTLVHNGRRPKQLNQTLCQKSSRSLCDWCSTQRDACNCVLDGHAFRPNHETGFTKR